VYSAEIGRMKSEPEFFTEATLVLMEFSDVHSIVFLDDAIDNVEVARRAGWTAVHFEPSSWSERMEEALSTAVSAR
jgi:HAD superfamily hydrolase (TIGR01509 family)